MNYPETNPFASPHAGQFAAQAAEADRIGFIQRTYLHLCGAILAFVAIEAAIFALVPEDTLMRTVQMMQSSWLIVMIAFMGVGWIADRWASSGASQVMQYAALLLYVVAQAVICLPLLAYAQWRAGSDIIQPAAIVTLIMFGGLTAFVFVGRFDFSFMRMYLFWGGMVALALIVCSILFGFNLGMAFMVAMVALASGYILFQTRKG